MIPGIDPAEPDSLTEGGLPKSLSVVLVLQPSEPTGTSDSELHIFCPAIGRQYGDGGFLSSCESVARTTVCWLCIKFICLSDYTSRSPSRLYPSQLSAMAVNCRNSIYHFNNRLPRFFMYLVSNAEKVYSLVLLLLVGGVQRAE